MNSIPDVAFVLVGWNIRDLLLQCLASIKHTVTEVSYEIIYVDNGSVEGTVETICREYPEVRVISNPVNRGFAAGNNQGIEASSARYLVILNTDTILKEAAIANAVAYMDEHPDVGCCGGELLNEDETRQNTIHNDPTLATELLNKSLLAILSPNKYPSKRQAYTEPVDVDACLGAYLVVRREVLDNVGPLDEGYFFYFEETDWCTRMRAAGWRVVFLPSSKIYHLQGKTVTAYRRECKVEYYRSRYRYFRKHRGRLKLGILATMLFLRLVFNTFMMSVLNLLTLFQVSRWRARLRVYWGLLRWHVALCPGGYGLSTAGPEVAAEKET